MLKQTNSDGFCAYASEHRLRGVAHCFLAINQPDASQLLV